MKRRQVLAGLGATGMAAFVGLGIGTKGAVQYTTAQSTEPCENVQLSAEWRETYTRDGDTVLLENNSAENSTATATPTEQTAGQGGDPAIITLDGILPEDRGTVGFRLTADESSTQDTVTPTLSIDIENSSENGVTDPEREAGDDPNVTDEGDLEEFVQVKVWKDTGVLGFQDLGGENLNQEFTEETIIDDTLEQASTMSDVALGSLDTTNSDDSVAATLRWEFADGPNVNKAQGDSVKFTLDIGCQ